MHIAAASLDGTLKIWNTRDGSIEWIFISEEPDIKSFVFSQNGKYIYAGYDSGVIVKYDLKNGT